MAAHTIGIITCAPWGAEGASLSERRGQIILIYQWHKCEEAGEGRFLAFMPLIYQTPLFELLFI